MRLYAYPDDFTIYGDISKLRKAMKKATVWAHDKFGLKIKDIWQFYQVASFNEEKENHEERKKGSKKRTPGVDMMGYVVRRRYDHPWQSIPENQAGICYVPGGIFQKEDLSRGGGLARLQPIKDGLKHSDSQKFRKIQF